MALVMSLNYLLLQLHVPKKKKKSTCSDPLVCEIKHLSARIVIVLL